MQCGTMYIHYVNIFSIPGKMKLRKYSFRPGLKLVCDTNFFLTRFEIESSNPGQNFMSDCAVNILEDLWLQNAEHQDRGGPDMIY